MSRWGCWNQLGFNWNLTPITPLITLDGKVYAGDLPRRALSLVREWLALHREEVAADWALALAKKPLNSIEPLE